MAEVLSLVSLLLLSNIPLDDVSIFGMSVHAIHVKTLTKSYRVIYKGKKYVLTVEKIGDNYKVVVSDKDNEKYTIIGGKR